MALIGIVSGCNSTNLNLSRTWKTYQNQRYNFEFVYPGDWQPMVPPDNGDGQAFQAPQNSQVEIRGWASHHLPKITATAANLSADHTSSGLASPFTPNFTTQQGTPGELKINIDSEISSMTLTLVQANTQYYLRGQSPSDQFAEYYPLFYAIARQYRIRN